jgi:hypothetical protein
MNDIAGAGGIASVPAGEPHLAQRAGDPKTSRGLLRSGDRLDPVSGYEFVEREKASHAVVPLCQVLEVSPRRYWAWRQRGPCRRAHADAPRTEPIRTIHQTSHGTYGVPRIHTELGRGEPIADASASPASCSRRG